MKRLTFIFISLAFISCESDTNIKSTDQDTIIAFEDTVQVEKNSETERGASFTHVYSMLVDAMYNKKNQEFRSFIHPQHGIKFISNFSGAMPELIEFDKTAKFGENKQIKNTFKQLDSLLLKEAIIESLPNVICDTTIYDKSGCFAYESNSKLQGHPWNANGKYDDLINNVTWTVVNTHNFTFFFSEIDEQYYLTFIDIRTPCEA